MANYVDVNPGDQAQDFNCQPRTYDGHDGVDFALRDQEQLRQGVSVVAAASGMVRAIRNDMEDALLEQGSSDRSLAGRECGNGVVLDHEDGWQTQYCHLRRGSVLVEAGDRVNDGSRLGLVGLSGNTEFPHVHVTVRRHGRVIDPFTGNPMTGGCELGGERLWRDEASVSYEPVALYHAGFAGESPDVTTIRNGRGLSASLSAASPALVLWVDAFGVQSDDRVSFHIIGPLGKVVLDHETRIDRTQARRFLFAGQRRQTDTWQGGVYTGQVTLTRHHGGQLVELSIIRRVTIK